MKQQASCVASRGSGSCDQCKLGYASAKWKEWNENVHARDSDRGEWQDDTLKFWHDASLSSLMSLTSEDDIDNELYSCGWCASAWHTRTALACPDHSVPNHGWLTGLPTFWITPTQTHNDPWEMGDLDLWVINPQVFPWVYLWVLMDHWDSWWSLLL